MLTVINFPEVRRGSLRAVQYSAQNVVVYDDSVDHRQAVWNDTSLDACVPWMEAMESYCSAAMAHKESPSEETAKLMSAAYLVLPPGWHSPALSMARTRKLPTPQPLFLSPDGISPEREAELDAVIKRCTE